MSREQVLHELSGLILDSKQSWPLRVGIDGIDAAGKTFLSNELAAHLRAKGAEVLRASIDGFHNPKQIRQQRGALSPQGYYHDSFNYPLLKEYLLEPLAPAGKRLCRASAFDFKSDSPTLAEELCVTDGCILLFEGVFLFRPELLAEWDLKIFVDIDFQTSLERALQRDLELFGNQQEITRRYRERYIPGQQLYLESVKPKTRADIIFDNRDFMNPGITLNKKQISQNP